MSKQTTTEKKLIDNNPVSTFSPSPDRFHGDWEFPVAIHEYNFTDINIHSIRWHWHDEIELLFVDYGEVEVLADNISIIAKKGQVVFIKQNVLHSIQVTENCNKPKFRSLIFHPSFLFGYGKTLMDANYAVPLVENSQLKCKLFDRLQGKDFLILDCITELLDLLTKKKWGYELLSKALLCKIWYLLLISSSSTQPKYTKTKRIVNDEERIKNALLYIENHYSENITLDDIANFIHISKSECCRCFKRVLHMSPFEYLMKFRIFSATRIIQRHDEQISSIGSLATAVGFSNISYFNKVFKKYLEITPSEYREKFKLDASDETLIQLPSLYGF